MSSKLPWILFIPVACFILFDFTQMDIMNSLAPFLLHSLSVTPSMLGVIGSLYFWVNLITLLFAGWMLDRYSPKWLIILSICISLIGLAIFILHPTLRTLVIWRTLGGIAGGFSYLSAIKILSMMFPKNRMGLMIGLSGLTAMLAGALAQTPIIALLHHIGLGDTLWWNLIAGVVVVLLCYWLIPHLTMHREKTHPHLFNWRPYLSLRNWCLALFASLDNLPLFLLGALWGNLYLTHAHLVSQLQASWIIMLMFAGNIVGAPLIGMTSDRLGSRSKVMLSGALILMVILLLLCLAPIYHAIVLGGLFFLVGFFVACQTPAYAAAIDHSAPEDSAKATSLICFLSVFGIAASQPLFGWIAEMGKNQANGYTHGMWVIVISNFICIVLAITYLLFFRRRQQGN